MFENSTIGTTDSTLVGEVIDLDSGNNALISYSVVGTSKCHLKVLCLFKYVTSYVLPLFSCIYDYCKRSIEIEHATGL